MRYRGGRRRMSFFMWIVSASSQVRSGNGTPVGTTAATSRLIPKLILAEAESVCLLSRTCPLRSE